jgi:hypothetical protein
VLGFFLPSLHNESLCLNQIIFKQYIKLAMQAMQDKQQTKYQKKNMQRKQNQNQRCNQ